MVRPPADPTENPKDVEHSSERHATSRKMAKPNAADYCLGNYLAVDGDYFATRTKARRHNHLRWSYCSDWVLTFRPTVACCGRGTQGSVLHSDKLLPRICSENESIFMNRRVPHGHGGLTEQKTPTTFAAARQCSAVFAGENNGGPERRNTVHANQVGRRVEEAAGGGRPQPPCCAWCWRESACGARAEASAS